MVLTIEEAKELEDLKQKNRKEIMGLQATQAKDEHQRKLLQLDKLLEIAKAGGIGYIEK